MRLVALLALAGTPVVWAQSTISVDVRLVSASFSVRNVAGELLTTLEQDDIELLEDGQPQKIAFFSRGTDLPLHLALVVDYSPSQDDFVKEHRRDIKLFLETLLEERDKVVAVGVGNYVRAVAENTTDANWILERLRQYGKNNINADRIGPEERRSGGTALFDGLYHTTRERLESEEAGRRAMVVLSDGADNASIYNLMDVVEEAQNADVRVFGIWYAEARRQRYRARERYGQRVMDRIAFETGGERLSGAGTDLGAQFQRIAEELRSSYTVRYYSSNAAADGRFRRLEIRPKAKGLKVRAKAGYFAK